jgi:hypothetical protein
VYWRVDTLASCRQRQDTFLNGSHSGLRGGICQSFFVATGRLCQDEHAATGFVFRQYGTLAAWMPPIGFVTSEVGCHVGKNLMSNCRYPVA